MKKRILSMVLCIAMLMSMVAMLSGCNESGPSTNGPKKVDAFVIMTENLDGLFNPFYYTAANDGTIVSMTQISMIGAKYVNNKIEVAYGENEAVVTKDYDIVYNEEDDTTTYRFVLKNGIKFSDGHPLTMEDVLFNYYVYLDPVYTGSNTLYSTDILGLAAYRTQQHLSDSGSGDSAINASASTAAGMRINELAQLFAQNLEFSDTNALDEVAMEKLIKEHGLSDGYISAISNDPTEVTWENLWNDYQHALELFRAELNRDWASAQESYTDEPYKSHAEFQDPIFKFMFMEGYATAEYAKGEDGKIDRTKIEKLNKGYNPDVVNTMEKAIEHVYEDKTTTELNMIVTAWATAGELMAEYTAKAKEVLLNANKTEDGLLIDSISGIVSLGHTDMAGKTITVNGTEYTVASDHDKDGVPTNANEYDVLQITIDGVDPKAIWNFSLTVAPQHYYGKGAKTPVDIAKNKFGVDFADFTFMTEIIQSTNNIKLPMGAGAYKCTDASNSDNPQADNFYKDNVVYFKANDQFTTVGAELENAKIDKIRYQVVSSNNAINALKEGTVHYISPAMTTLNYKELTDMESQGFVKMSTDQLGYGYIGINAKHVKHLALRRAIMCAMDTSLAIGYYEAGTASQVMWNMSKVSWAYPTGSDANFNDKEYPQYGKFNKDYAIENIQRYMRDANASEGDPRLKITFTIAGSTLQDHPTYAVFRDAAALLNSLGWQVEVVCDTQALTKIATGSLQVWAAAWSSSLDPDMYQVYHKDSSATSTKAWGYDYLLTSGTTQERGIMDNLADLIDQAREITEEKERAELYKKAMGYILDLAVELPVYQRDVLYAYNANVIKSDSMPAQDELNPYSSPLDRIWEIEYAAN